MMLDQRKGEGVMPDNQKPKTDQKDAGTQTRRRVEQILGTKPSVPSISAPCEDPELEEGEEK